MSVGSLYLPPTSHSCCRSPPEPQLAPKLWCIRLILTACMDRHAVGRRPVGPMCVREPCVVVDALHTERHTSRRALGAFHLRGGDFPIVRCNMHFLEHCTMESLTLYRRSTQMDGWQPHPPRPDKTLPNSSGMSWTSEAGRVFCTSASTQISSPFSPHGPRTSTAVPTRNCSTLCCAVTQGLTVLGLLLLVATAALEALIDPAIAKTIRWAGRGLGRPRVGPAEGQGHGNAAKSRADSYAIQMPLV